MFNSDVCCAIKVAFYRDSIKKTPELYKAIREACGISQEVVAKSLGVTTMTISNYENGRSLPACNNVLPYVDLLHNIAKVVGVDIDTIHKSVMIESVDIISNVIDELL